MMTDIVQISATKIERTEAPEPFMGYRGTVADLIQQIEEHEKRSKMPDSAMVTIRGIIGSADDDNFEEIETSMTKAQLLLGLRSQPQRAYVSAVAGELVAGAGDVNVDDCDDECLALFFYVPARC